MNSLTIWYKIPLIFFQVLFIVSGILILKYYYNKRRFFTLGNKLPGPKPWPLVGNALYFVSDRAKRWDLLGMTKHLNDKFGFTRLWLGHQLHVVLCTPEDAKIFCTSSALLDRPDLFKFILEPVFGEGLPTANGAKWKESKQLLEPKFKYKYAAQFSSIYQKKSDILIRLLDSKTGSTFSIYHHISKCMCDISCEAFFGHSINIQEKESTIHDAIEKIGKYASNRIYSIWQQFDIIFNRTKAGKRFYRTVNAINDFIKNNIEIFESNIHKEELNPTENKEENGNHRSFILHLYRETAYEDIKDHILSTMGASVDTTSTTISFALMMLGKHTDVQTRLYDEICSVAEKGFDDSKLQKSSYLDMVIKETLRLFSPVALTIRKANEDILFGEYLVPKEALVSLNIFALHRDPNQYKNPDHFDPDRFLPENSSKRHPYSFIPFGMGKRKCIGGNFAYIVIRLILAKIIYNYRIECDWDVNDIQLRFYIATKAKNLNYPIRLFRR